MDLLGSEYGWSKEHIYYQVYVDELFYLAKKINLRKVRGYKMQLSIVQNPHVKDPAQLWQALESEERQYGTIKKIAEFDELGFELLKQKMRENPRMIVKD